MMNERDITVITDEIISLFEHHGSEDYDGEPVSQTSHMVQCAMQAIAVSADPELVLGAFLHDVGHLLRHQQQTAAMDTYGVANHEGIGAGYLRTKGFSERVCAIVEMHVPAKRYLVTTDPSYKEKLSEASIQTMVRWQGGLMSAGEAERFRMHPYFDDIIKVRMWDEEAKKQDAVLLSLPYFRKLISHHLQRNH